MNEDLVAENLRRMSDRIVNLILHDQIEWIDVLIETEAMREYCRQNAPERLELFEMIFPPRFERVWKQFGPPTRPHEWE